MDPMPSESNSVQQPTVASPSSAFQSLQEKRERGKNFSLKETALLASCWLAVSCDPIVGADQQASTFWERIIPMWELEKQKDPMILARTLQSLQSHWSDCSKSVQKFSGIINKILNDLPSGWNEQMAFDEALSHYKDITKKAFHKFIDAYKVLKDAPKFKIVAASRPNKVLFDEENESPQTFQPIERPIGTKRAKRDREAGRLDSDVKRAARLEEISAAAKAMAKASEERNRLNEDKFTLSLFQNDPNSADSQEFMRLNRAEYIKRLKERVQ